MVPLESSAVAVMVMSGKVASFFGAKLMYFVPVAGEVILTLGEVLFSEKRLQKFQISLPV